MEVDEHDRRLAARLLDQLVDHLERGDGRLHEEVAEQVDHRHSGVVPRRRDGHSPPGRLGGEIRGPDQPLAAREVGDDLSTPPGVVAEREHVHAGRKEHVRELRRDADAIRHVLAVGNAEVDVQLLAQ